MRLAPEDEGWWPAVGKPKPDSFNLLETLKWTAISFIIVFCVGLIGLLIWYS